MISSFAYELFCMHVGCSQRGLLQRKKWFPFDLDVLTVCHVVCVHHQQNILTLIVNDFNAVFWV